MFKQAFARLLKIIYAIENAKGMGWCNEQYFYYNFKQNNFKSGYGKPLLRFLQSLHFSRLTPKKSLVQNFPNFLKKRHLNCASR